MRRKFVFSNNPFVTGQPVYGNNFIDRKDILDKIVSFLNNKKQFVFLLFGQRRIGKTSLLRHSEKQIKKDKNFRTIYLNLQDLSDLKHDNVIYEIIQQLSNDLGVDFSSQELNINNFFDDFIFALNNSEKPLIVLIDEFDSVSKIQNKQNQTILNFFESKISFIAENNLSIKFIFAIGRNFNEADNEDYTILKNLGTKANLNFFKPIRLKELLKLSEPDIVFSEDAEKQIYRLTAGHPLFSQCLAAKAYKFAVKNQQRNISAEMIKNQFLNAVKSYGSNIIWIWESLSEIHKKILYSILELYNEKKAITFDELNIKCGIEQKETLQIALEQLLNHNFVKIKNENYYFKAKFFMAWVQKNIKF
jgi:branched-chain amino acid transport system substrate-binding protein